MAHRRYRRWLLRSTAGGNEYPMLELPGDWDPPDSVRTPRLCEALESQARLFVGNEIKKETHGENQI